MAPFRPLSLFGRSFWAEDLLPALPPEPPVYLCPAVAGYVGGDITAGLLAADADKAEELTLFLDVGTNGEMALGDKNGWLCCAAAAGYIPRKTTGPPQLRYRWWTATRARCRITTKSALHP